MDIKSAVILITSAGSQLGSTLAMHFASFDGIVIICDTNAKQLNDTFTRCKKISSNIYQHAMNDHSLGSINSLFEFIDQSVHQSPDVLINALTSQTMPKFFDERASDIFTQHLSLMAATLFTFGQATAEKMRQDKKNGVIVNVIAHADYSDMSGFENATSMVAGFTQSWAKELNPFNIRVGGVVPCYEQSNIHWAKIRDDLIRNTEYIVSNDYFSGRVMAA